VEPKWAMVDCYRCRGTGMSPYAPTGACPHCYGSGATEVRVCAECEEHLTDDEAGEDEVCRRCRRACQGCGEPLDDNGVCHYCDRTCAECGDWLGPREWDACGPCVRGHMAASECYEEVGA